MTIYSPPGRRPRAGIPCAVALVLAATLGVSCGKKGPPLAPLVRIPAPVERVVARRLADTIYVEVTIPSRNQDNSTPGDVARVDVYGFTGTPRNDEDLLQRGTLVTSVPVRKPAPPDEDKRPARNAGQQTKQAQAEPGADQGATVTVIETLTPDLMKALPSPKPAPGEQATPPPPVPAPAGQADATAAAVPAPTQEKPVPGTTQGKPAPGAAAAARQVLARLYVAVPFNHKGRRGALSRRASVPIEGQPAPPQDLKVDYSETQVAVSWQAPDLPLLATTEEKPTAKDNAAAETPAVAYNVYSVARPSQQGATPSVPSGPRTIAAPTPLNEKPVSTTLFSEPVKFDAERCYVVRTVSTIGGLQQESAPSSVVCVTPKDRFPPAAPKGLTAVTSAGSISLLWEPNSEADLAGYLVLRGVAGEVVKLEPVTSEPIHETTLTDTTVVAGTRYVYAIVAIDRNGNVGAQSDRVEQTAQRIPQHDRPMDKLYRLDDHGVVRYAIERDGHFFLIEGDWLGAYSLGREIGPAERPGGVPAGYRLLAPVVPGKIVGVGLNYRNHAAETGKAVPTEPLIFLKPSTAVIAHGEAIRIPPAAGRVDHEAEMAVVIGRRASHVPRERAGEYVAGVTCANDVTARAMQRRGVQYSHCKGYDTFAPLGPCIALGLDTRHLHVEGWVNGERRQAGNAEDLIFPIDELVAYVSAVMTLMPGDVISTGTPEGIAPLEPGDTVTVKVQGVGELTNPVELAQA